MAYTYDLLASDAATLQIARVRLYADDKTDVAQGGVQGRDHFLSDVEIAELLSNCTDRASTAVNRAKLAAAAAKRILAGNQVYVLKVAENASGERTDGESVAKELRAQAQALEDEVAASELVILAASAAPTSGAVRTRRRDGYSRYGGRYDHSEYTLSDC